MLEVNYWSIVCCLLEQEKIIEKSTILCETTSTKLICMSYNNHQHDRNTCWSFIKIRRQYNLISTSFMVFINSDKNYQGYISLQKIRLKIICIEYRINNNIKRAGANTYRNRILNYHYSSTFKFLMGECNKIHCCFICIINVSILWVRPLITTSRT